jgi:hypothetical protein
MQTPREHIVLVAMLSDLKKLQRQHVIGRRLTAGSSTTTEGHRALSISHPRLRQHSRDATQFARFLSASSRVDRFTRYICVQYRVVTVSKVSEGTEQVSWAIFGITYGQLAFAGRVAAKCSCHIPAASWKIR